MPTYHQNLEKIVQNCKPYRTYHEMAKIWPFWPCVTSLFDPITIWWVAGKVLPIPTYHQNFERFQSKLQPVEQEMCYSVYGGGGGRNQGWIQSIHF